MIELCIWKDPSKCIDCELKGLLHCHPYLQHSLYFAIAFFSVIIPAILGIILGGWGIIYTLLIFSFWICFALFFFCVWESKVLCSHCPHYSNPFQKTLHCGINSGMYKITTFNPKPMNRSEKTQFLVGASILLLYPLPFLLISSQIVPFILTCLGILIWIATIQLKHCKECINFSCPLNRVSEELKHKFLNKNPQLEKVWKEERNLD
ncbi:MAG: hypothetical protein EU542_02235 [Promethearchaeota archaeon]|nr:MAG: hypothetical protein EU542_02235 [Candidatus Lokiarchaeota archaeon]